MNEKYNKVMLLFVNSLYLIEIEIEYRVPLNPYICIVPFVYAMNVRKQFQ